MQTGTDTFHTAVSALQVENQLRTWLLFGTPVASRPTAHGVCYFFAPHSFVGFSHQRLNDFGIVQWECFLFRTTSPGFRCQQLPLVTPGADLLSYTSGKAHARTFQAYADVLDDLPIEDSDLPSLHRRCAPFLQRGTLPHRIIHRYLTERGRDV
jgi:hypothetical protein